MLPYSGEIGYNQIRGEFNSPSNFSLKDAATGVHGAFNPYSFIQPSNTGATNHSPGDWYGYDGKWIVTSGLQTHWDAWPTVLSYPGSGTTITDVSANSFNGTLFNGTIWDGSQGGGSWLFDGVDDYIASSATAYTSFATEITVDFWVKFNAPVNFGQGVGQAVFNNYDNPPAGQNMWLMHGNGGGADSITFFAWDTSFNVISGPTTSTISVGNWFNVICTMNGGSSTMYTNGVVSGTGPGSGPGLNNNASSVLFMGGDVRFDFRRMNGNIAALKVYNRALTSTEALQNFGALRGRFNI
jgi:hypothetical protein